MNRTTATLALASSIALSALAGCETNNNVPPGAAQDPVLAHQYPYITIERPLQKFAVVDYGSIIVTRTDGARPMAVEVPVRSTAYQQMAIQHRFQWYDGDGRHLKDDGWVFSVLEPGLQAVLKSNATTLNAEQYRLEIRSAR